jgi:hypothetical protein
MQVILVVRAGITWRSHPVPGPGTLAEKFSRWQDRYGVLFAVMVQILLSAGAPCPTKLCEVGVAVQVLLNGRGLLPVDNAGKGYWRSIAVGALSKPENYHGAETKLRTAVGTRVQCLAV